MGRSWRIVFIYRTSYAISCRNQQRHSDRIEQLIKADKSFKNKLYVHYWDCDPKYLIEAIEAEFGPQLSSAEIKQLKKYPPMIGKFLHRNFIELMEVMSIEPISRQLISLGKWKRLEPGQIYESLLSMKRKQVFAKLRRHSIGPFKLEVQH